MRSAKLIDKFSATKEERVRIQPSLEDARREKESLSTQPHRRLQKDELDLFVAEARNYFPGSRTEGREIKRSWQEEEMAEMLKMLKFLKEVVKIVTLQ